MPTVPLPGLVRAELLSGPYGREHGEDHRVEDLGVPHQAIALVGREYRYWYPHECHHQVENSDDTHACFFSSAQWGWL